MMKNKNTTFFVAVVSLMIISLSIFMMYYILARQVSTPYSPPTNDVTSQVSANYFLSISDTKVIRFIPEIPNQARSGVCLQRSSATPYTWRCTAEEKSQIFDPCYLAEDETTVVCGVNPLNDDPGFRLKLTVPLPVDGWTPTETPWPHGTVVELADGTVCDMDPSGTSLVFNHARVNYWCGMWNEQGSNIGILGDLQVGTIWAAERIVVERHEHGWEIIRSETIPIRVVWQ